MVVISRTIGESISIFTGPHDQNCKIVTVTVIAFKADGRVCLGIEAPREYPIERGEIYWAVRDANRRSDT